MNFSTKKRYTVIGITFLFIGLSIIAVLTSTHNLIIRNIKATFFAPIAKSIVAKKKQSVGAAITSLRPVIVTSSNTLYHHSVNSGTLAAAALPIDANKRTVNSSKAITHAASSVKRKNDSVADTSSKENVITVVPETDIDHRLTIGEAVSGLIPLNNSEVTTTFYLDSSGTNSPDTATTSITTDNPTIVKDSVDVVSSLKNVKDPDNVVPDATKMVSLMEEHAASAMPAEADRNIIEEKSLQKKNAIITDDDMTTTTIVTDATSYYNNSSIKINANDVVVTTTTSIPNKTFSTTVESDSQDNHLMDDATTTTRNHRLSSDTRVDGFTINAEESISDNITGGTLIVFYTTE